MKKSIDINRSMLIVIGLEICNIWQYHIGQAESFSPEASDFMLHIPLARNVSFVGMHRLRRQVKP
jgi:hypothetical protein